jgi:hypothetical protein
LRGGWCFASLVAVLGARRKTFVTAEDAEDAEENREDCKD